MRLDHVNLAVRDLDVTAARLRDRLGLGVQRFPGDAGAHVPLAGHQYLELHTSAIPGFGDFIAHHARDGDRWYGWSVRPDGPVDGTPFGVDEGTAFTPWRGTLARIDEMGASRGLVPYLTAYDPDVDLDRIFADKHADAAHASRSARSPRSSSSPAGASPTCASRSTVRSARSP